MREFLTVAVSLVLVLGLIVLTFWAGKFLTVKGFGNNGKYFKIIDRIALGKEKYLVIVQIREQSYLIGVSEKTIVLLEKWDDVFPIAQTEEKNISFEAVLERLKKKTHQADQEREL